MAWRSVNFDWNRARAFLVAAEEGSLSAAARALGVAQPTLGRQVAALEDELGVALFERGSSGLELTPDGMELLQHVRAMGEAAGQLSLTASGRSDSIEGDVCISATEAMAMYRLPDIIKRLRKLHPGINIELIATNSSSDLKKREADIAIRAYQPSQPDLIARKLCDLSAYLYGSREYLKQLGNPKSVEDLKQASFIDFDSNYELMAELNRRGLELSPDNFPIITESHLVHWELVKQGAGIGIMVEEVGDAEPTVERVLPDLKPYSSGLWLVAHRELRTNRRIRAVFDFLVEELADS